MPLASKSAIVGHRNANYIPSTRGSIRSWQYEFAVSEIANSSSVNSEAESKGSSQLSATGACAYRLVIVENLVAVPNCLRKAALIIMNMYTQMQREYGRKKKSGIIFTHYEFTPHSGSTAEDASAS